MIKNATVAVWALGAAGCIGACQAANASETKDFSADAYQGVVEHEERQLAFEVAGRVLRVEVARGDQITPKTELAALDDSLERANRAGRLAEIHLAEAQLQQLQHGARPAERRRAQAEAAAATATEALLRQNLERAKRLAAGGAATQSTVDDLQGQLDAAIAKRTALEEQARLIAGGSRTEEIEAARARLEAAQAGLQVIDERLRRYVLHSDVTASVIDLLVETNEVVAPGAPIMSLADLAHPYVDVFVPQARLGEVRIGASAHVRTDGVQTSLPGKVEHIAQRTEFTPRFLFSERERPNLVVRVRVRVDDPQHRLRAGVPAFVSFGERGPT